jgi:hypothetical protein
MTRIKQSPLFFEIKTFAPKIFHAWHWYVQDVYAHVSPEEQDQARLFQDVLEAFADALESVQSEKYSEKRSIPGWSYGYICGFAAGNLETKWYTRYVVPHEEEFQHILLLKSLVLLFEADQQTREKFWNVHRYVSTDFLAEGYGMHTISPEQDMHNVVRLSDYDPTNQRAVEELWQQTKQHWEEQFERKYDKLLRRQDQRGGVPNLTEYVNQREIEALLEDSP